MGTQEMVIIGTWGVGLKLGCLYSLVSKENTLYLRSLRGAVFILIYSFSASGIIFCSLTPGSILAVCGTGGLLLICVNSFESTFQREFPGTTRIFLSKRKMIPVHCVNLVFEVQC